MMLDAERRARYARHRSLVELGDDGVIALLRADSGAPLSDPRAEFVRADYLARAGLAPADEEGFVDVDVASFAGADYLEEAAAACLGALHAVARIRVAAGLDPAANIPQFQLLEGSNARSR